MPGIPLPQSIIHNVWITPEPTICLRTKATPRTPTVCAELSLAAPVRVPPPRPQQIQPGARGKSQLIVTHLDVHPPRSIVPGHSLGIGILKISPVTPRTTLLPYDTRPIKGSVRLILRPRCRLSLRSRGTPTPIFPPKRTSTIGRGGVLYLSPSNFNSRPRSGIQISAPERITIGLFQLKFPSDAIDLRTTSPVPRSPRSPNSTEAHRYLSRFPTLTVSRDNAAAVTFGHDATGIPPSEAFSGSPSDDSLAPSVPRPSARP